jgi:hypothetical protein
MSRLGRESDPVSNTLLQPSSRAQLKLESAKSRWCGLRLNIEPLARSEWGHTASPSICVTVGSFAVTCQLACKTGGQNLETELTKLLSSNDPSVRRRAVLLVMETEKG